MKNKEELKMKVYSLKMQIQAITDNIKNFENIRKDMSDRLFEAEQELYHDNKDALEKEGEL